ncbi:MAG: NTP transferase domain-containing protein [Deltaproteobacteria bacterium]|nr:NTP transferase domain-containing protein [Deltaproteobacteria bacterium]NIS77272.1 NTP transferase domain-containing protein [Deltaproteobacteria bacterium]
MGVTPEFLVIPAAGHGLRMKDLRPGLPKEMLPVGEKPAIQHAVLEGVSAGIGQIVIVINRRKEIIRRYFEERRFRESAYPLAAGEMDEILRACSIHFSYQENATGEWDAISLSREFVGNGSLAILFPDNVYFPPGGALILLKEIFERYGIDVTALVAVPEAWVKGLGNSGRVDILPLAGGVFRIERFYPKARGTFITRHPGELRSCGISIYGPHLFDYIERARGSLKEGEEFTDVSVRSLILQEREMLGCRLPGTLFDIGNPAGYRHCLSYIGEDRS